MSAELAVIDGGDPLDEVDRTVAQLRAARGELGSLDFEQLFAIRSWAEALGAAARAKRAAAVAREAAETQVRAERRLGRLLTKSADLASQLDISKQRSKTWTTLAKMPDHLFEETISNMLGRGCACRASAVISQARRATLEKVEPGIKVSWDGVYFTVNGANPRQYNGGDKTHGSLAEAREFLRKQAGLTKTWQKNPLKVQLDDLHARARQIAQAIALVRETYGSQLGSHKLGDAEWKCGEVARILYELYLERPDVTYHGKEKW